MSAYSALTKECTKLRDRAERAEARVAALQVCIERRIAEIEGRDTRNGPNDEEVGALNALIDVQQFIGNAAAAAAHDAEVRAQVKREELDAILSAPDGTYENVPLGDGELTAVEIRVANAVRAPLEARIAELMAKIR